MTLPMNVHFVSFSSICRKIFSSFAATPSNLSYLSCSEFQKEGQQQLVDPETTSRSHVPRSINALSLASVIVVTAANVHEHARRHDRSNKDQRRSVHRRRVCSLSKCVCDVTSFLKDGLGLFVDELSSHLLKGRVRISRTWNSLSQTRLLGLSTVAESRFKTSGKAWGLFTLLSTGLM